jgi:hypothetical protein
MKHAVGVASPFLLILLMAQVYLQVILPGSLLLRSSLFGGASSTLQPEDPQQGSDNPSLMQMNHGVKTTPKQRCNLGPAASPARGH